MKEDRMREGLVRITAAAMVLGVGLAASIQAGAAGEIVAERAYFTSKGPWLLWNKEKCAFDETEDHPEIYSGVLRKVDADGLSVVYVTAESTMQVSKTINGSFDKYAELSGIDMKMFDYEFPSKTKPIQVAQQVAAMKPSVVISSLWLPGLYPQVGRTYGDACVPFLDMFDISTTFKVPGFQAGFVASGMALADGIIDVVNERGWAPSDTWMLICGAPQIANEPGTDLDVLTTFRAKVGDTLKLPQNQISPILDCEGTPDAARIVTMDWLTAHPQATNVIAISWSDTVAVAMTQSLEQKGYTAENAVSAGGQANDPALTVMSKPNSIFQVNFDKNFPTWGIIGLSMAQDVVAGRPVPSFVDPGVMAVVGPEAASALLATR
jgi:hypothetical protein